MSEEQIIADQEIANPKDTDEMEQIKAEAQEAAKEKEEENVTSKQEPVASPTENADTEELPLPSEEDEKGEPEGGQLPKWTKERLARSKRKELEQAQENELLRAQLKTFQELLQQPVPALDTSAPRKEQFADESEFIAAMVDHTIQKDRQRAQLKAEQDRVQKEHLDLIAKAQAAIELGTGKYKDFEEVVNPLFSKGFPANRVMAEVITDSDFSSDILYFLGKNNKEALRIAQLPAGQAAKEIYKLEQRFLERKKTRPVPPAPIKSEGGTRVGAGAPINLAHIAEKGDQEDFEAAFDQFVKKKKKF